MIVLHDFQKKIKEDIKEAIRQNHRKILVQSPTGSGKTVIFSSIVKDADLKEKKCLIITDRIELLSGTDNTLIAFGLKTTTVTSGQKYPPKIYTHCVAMSQTLRLRLKRKVWIDFINSFSIIIIDEAHVQEFNVYFESNVINNHMFILGFTATPKRTKKQRKLSDDYTKLIVGPQIPDLIKRGFLVKDVYYAPRYFDVSGIKLNSFGDYKESEMYDKFNKNNLYLGVIKNWKTLTENTITLVFCVNIAHSINTCKAFNEAGIDAKFIVSGLSNPIYDDAMTDAQFEKFKEKKELYNEYKSAMVKYSGVRENIIQEWKDGKFKVLINTGIYTKGFDYKQIETVIVNRATTSESLWLQMIGRGSRTFKGKTHFNILDFGSNAERLGFYNQEREWSLEQLHSNSEGVAPVKECGLHHGKKKVDKNNNEGCGCLILASKMICDYCGYIFEKDKFDIEVDLIKIDYAKNDFIDLERIAEERGYKFAWIIRRIIEKKGLEGLEEFAKYKNYNIHWVHRTKQMYSKEIEYYEEHKMRNEVL